MLAIANSSKPGAGLPALKPKPKAAYSVKILVVDNHFLIREALRGILKEVKGDATVVEAVDGRQAMQLVSEEAGIGFVVLGLDLPDRDGFSVLRELRERYPGVSVVVLSARQDRDTVINTLNLGAVGFIPKSGRREIMLRALQLIFAGGIYIPPEILEREDSSFSESRLICVDAGKAPVKSADLGLTGRQDEVLQLMMLGKSNKGICRVLNLAEPTVKNHVTAILKAFKVTNRTEAVIAAGELGLELPPASRTLPTVRYSAA